MSYPGDPPEPAARSSAAQQSAHEARERLRREIERVREGVEDLIGEQEGGGGGGLRQELDELRIETRVRGEMLERRLERAEAERRRAEWQFQANIEAMLDSLLREIRETADRLAGVPPRPTG
jgi:hypothetical protein